jgi:hypothetical protein
MDEITWFVPGLSVPPPPRSISAYFPAMPEGVAATYVAALTQSGDLVIDPFCQTGRVLRESVAAGRRALGANLNPVAVHWIETLLWPPESHQATAALVRLGDAPRGDVTLRQHVMGLYATRCPTCSKDAVAESFVWKRDAGEPVEKRVRCAACGATASAGPADEADVMAARRFESRGMAYWFALERAAPKEPEERERAAAVIEAYTTRTLSALADILRKYDAASPADQAALTPVLLSALEAALALHSAEEERPRPRSLKTPSTFIERNVWLAMEDALRAILPPPAVLPRSPNVSSLLAGRETAACLVTSGGRALPKLVPAGSVRLIMAVPPQPDPTFWALSAVWAGWLWAPGARGGAPSQIAESVRLLLARRRADMDWWWRGVAQALGALVPVLAENGHIVLVSPQMDEDTLTGLVLAGAAIGLALDHALVEPSEGLRVMWHAAPPPAPRELDAEALAAEIGDKARQSAGKALSERGEPTPWPFLHAAIQVELARSGLARIAARMPEGGPPPLELVKAATLEGLKAEPSPIYPLQDPRGLWWLADPSQAALPLADRIEAAVYDLLTRATPEHWESDLVAEVYRRFPGALTPERAYVRLCLESYATQTRPGVWALREQDLPALRQAEITSLRAELIALGQRLGCQVAERESQVAWIEARHPLITFMLTATAELGVHLLNRPPRGQPVLVLPGGRGALAHHKLRHDVRLSEAATGAGWTFLKFRQLRNLIAQPGLDRASFKGALGLDPLIEQEEQQMALL